jgi:tRNA (mo5U34)-methyltransferase
VAPTTEEAIAKINQAKWYHSFEVLPGVVTPGKNPTDAARIFQERFHLPKDLSGRRALDIGALDGPYAFELERRGAEVVAIDIQNPDRTGFNTAKLVRGSKARYVQGTAYDLKKLLTGKFDIICFFGVYYHMKHPLIAFEQIHDILADDGTLLLEGECLLNHAESPELPDSKPSEFVDTLAKSSLPISMFYPRTYKGDPWNWFIPNLACVRAWLEASGMELVSHGTWDAYPHQRMFGTAKKIKGARIEPDNPVW